MASKTTKIDVTVEGGELYLLARYGSGGNDVGEGATYEICHIKSGPGYSVDFSIVPQSILESGGVTLIMGGISWGGAYTLTVSLTQAGVPDLDTYTASSSTIENAGVKLLKGSRMGYVPGDGVGIVV
jgi:hypothetical protein